MWNLLIVKLNIWMPDTVPQYSDIFSLVCFRGVPHKERIFPFLQFGGVRKGGSQIFVQLQADPFLLEGYSGSIIRINRL